MSLFDPTTLLRQVPPELILGVKSGQYQIYGSIIRSMTSGRIVGHLQETAALQNMLSIATGGLPGLVGQGVKIVQQGVLIAQNEQIKAALDVVRSTQLATMALGAVSIGVSIAGTAIVCRQIQQVEQKVDAMAGQLARLASDIESLRQERLADDFTLLETLAEQIDECWLLEDAAPSWRDVARESHAVADRFERRARAYIEVSGIDTVLDSEPLTEAYALGSMIRVIARMAAGDRDAARSAAAARAETLVELGKRITVAGLALSATRSIGKPYGTSEWQGSLDLAVRPISAKVANFRTRELSAIGNALLLADLGKADISGRAWLEAARSEHANPLIYFPADI